MIAKLNHCNGAIGGDELLNSTDRLRSVIESEHIQGLPLHLLKAEKVVGFQVRRYSMVPVTRRVESNAL